MCLISCLRMALSRSIILKPLVDEHNNRGNLWQMNETISEVLRENQTGNYGVIARILIDIDPEDWAIICLWCSCNQENQALAAIHSQILAANNMSKYYKELYSPVNLLLLKLLFSVDLYPNIHISVIWTPSYAYILIISTEYGIDTSGHHFQRCIPLFPRRWTYSLMSISTAYHSSVRK